VDEAPAKPPEEMPVPGLAGHALDAAKGVDRNGNRLGSPLDRANGAGRQGRSQGWESVCAAFLAAFASITPQAGEQLEDAEVG
jgi:hypothetical protein